MRVDLGRKSREAPGVQPRLGLTGTGLITSWAEPIAMLPGRVHFFGEQPEPEQFLPGGNAYSGAIPS